MFTGIAPRYDLLNRVLSGGVDLWWRRRCAKAIKKLAPEGPVLDSCAGTLDLTVALRKHRGGVVHGADFSKGMLVRGRAKLARFASTPHRPSILAADALALPYADGTLAAVTVAFGIRNVSDVGRGLSEMARVLMPGGVCGILEFAMPTFPVFGALYRWYLTKMIPRIGRLVTGHDMDPYGYLAKSIEAFPDPAAFKQLCLDAGFTNVERKALTLGICSLWLCTK